MQFMQCREEIQTPHFNIQSTDEVMIQSKTFFIPFFAITE